jgi:hypothetical protein
MSGRQGTLFPLFHQNQRRAGLHYASAIAANGYAIHTRAAPGTRRGSAVAARGTQTHPEPNTLHHKLLNRRHLMSLPRTVPIPSPYRHQTAQ